MGLKLRVLYLGKMEFPRFRLVECDNEATMVVSPAVALLIQHPTLGNILYDTGNSADFLKTYTPEMLHNYPITEMITIEEALAKEGLTPGDIDQLILSHLHFDHAGGLQHFVGTKAIDHVLVSEADLKQAWWAVTTGNNGAYIRSLFDVEGIRFETIHDTTWLADDLGLFIQASHTPGVIGLILKTEHHGTILTTSDAIYTADSYRQAPAPWGHHQCHHRRVLRQPGADQGHGKELQRHPSLRPRHRPDPGLGGPRGHRLTPWRCASCPWGAWTFPNTGWSGARTRRRCSSPPPGRC